MCVFHLFLQNATSVADILACEFYIICKMYKKYVSILYVSSFFLFSGSDWKLFLFYSWNMSAVEAECSAPVRVQFIPWGTGNHDLEIWSMWSCLWLGNSMVYQPCRSDFIFSINIWVGVLSVAQAGNCRLLPHVRLLVNVHLRKLLVHTNSFVQFRAPIMVRECCFPATVPCSRVMQFWIAYGLVGFRCISS